MHNFMQMKNRTVYFQLCGVDATIIIAQTKMFYCTKFNVKINVDRPIWNVQFGAKCVVFDCVAILNVFTC